MSESRSWEEARARIEGLIGQEAWAYAEVTVRDADILRYHEAVGLPVPELPPDAVLVAPPMFLPPVAFGGDVDVDGRRRRPGEIIIDDPVLRRRVMGGCEVTFEAPIRAGETIGVSTTFESVVSKQGSAGPMLLVTTATEYRAADGELKRVERWTIVHR